MKKISFAIFAGVAMLAAQSATAAGTKVPSGTAITINDCQLLGEDATINLSKNVLGAYNCDVINTEIEIGTCHEAGSRKPKTLDCTGTDLPVAGCSTGATYDIPDFSGFTASSMGGTVSPVPLGGNCTDAAVQALIGV